jgi:glycosyltransferase involved in cell wall biosynthesis
LTNASNKLAIVIPTIGRYGELRRMLKSLAAQTLLPDEVIIVDEDLSSGSFARDFPQLKTRWIVLPGSASSKRNAGFKAACPEMTLIAFMDDDIVLEPQALEAAPTSLYTGAP